MTFKRQPVDDGRVTARQRSRNAKPSIVCGAVGIVDDFDVVAECGAHLSTSRRNGGVGSRNEPAGPRGAAGRIREDRNEEEDLSAAQVAARRGGPKGT